MWSLLFALKASANDSIPILEPQTCKIQFLDRTVKEFLISRCSGVLTSPNEVTTAGHCIAPLKVQGVVVAQATCGSETRETSTAILDSNYSLNTTQGKKDLAKLSFQEAFQTQPIEIAPESLKVKMMKLWKSDCKTEGFFSAFQVSSLSRNGTFVHSSEVVAESANEDQKTKIHELFKTLSEGKDRSQYRKAYIQTLLESGQIQKTTIAGDSGGPLYCRENPDSPWLLVGAVMGVNFRLFDDSLRGVLQLMFEQVWTEVSP